MKQIPRETSANVTNRADADQETNKKLYNTQDVVVMFTYQWRVILFQYARVRTHHFAEMSGLP